MSDSLVVSVLDVVGVQITIMAEICFDSVAPPSQLRGGARGRLAIHHHMLRL